ncbi:MAG: Rieske 2Fe-2S domain-containing protein [Polyangia bacterium]
MVEQKRRTLLIAASGAISVVIAGVVGVPVIRAFLDPLWRRSIVGTDGATAYGNISELPIGKPVERGVVGVIRDAWDRSDPKSIGALWLVRRDAKKVDAYSNVCPHAACPVGYDEKRSVFACPCHTSDFALADGHVLGGPSPRGLDSLPVEVKPDGTVFVTYQRFIAGTSAKREV